jgi:ABC-type uncharacterized transport system fused permease/ATPase subunit
MSNRNRYDNKYEDGLGMDALIGRHLQNYSDRISAPVGTREALLIKAQDQKNQSSFWMLVGAYLRAVGRFMLVVVSLSWLDTRREDSRDWIEDYVFEDYAITQWFYRRATMSSFMFGSGNFTLSG